MTHSLKGRVGPDRVAARLEAQERIQRILDTGRWPTGMPLGDRDRELLTLNARRDGLEVRA